MTSLYFNIHSIIKILFVNAPETVRDFLLIQLGHFFSSEVDDESESIDIIVQKMDDTELDLSKNSLWHSLYGFSVSKFKGRDAIFFQYKNSCDVIVSISDTIIIYYLERPGIHRKLYSILLYSINLFLNKKYGSLLHGAVIKKNDRCVMLAGPRGSMKTILVLTMLKHGWSFLSDDKCIIINRSVYMFQPTIPVRMHHFRALPWLDQYTDNTLEKNSTIKRICADLAIKLVHKRFFQPLNRFLNPAQLIRGDLFSSGSEIIQKEKLSDIVTLNVGESLRIDKLTKKGLIAKFTLIQEMANIDFTLIESMLKLKSHRVIHNLEKLIEHNIGEENFFRLSFSEKCNIDQVYQELIRCLRQQ